MLQFDGVDNYVSIPFFLNPGALTDWTFMLVFNATAQPTPGSGTTLNGGMVSQNRVSDGVRWLQHFVSAGQNHLRVPIANNLSVSSFSLNTWYLVFLRRIASPSSLRINLRRTGVNLTNNHVGTVESGTHETFLGFNGPFFNAGFEGWWPGKMDLMAHWNRRLTDSECDTMFNYAKTYLLDRDGISL